jgi:hypothetical protein
MKNLPRFGVRDDVGQGDGQQGLDVLPDAACFDGLDGFVVSPLLFALKGADAPALRADEQRYGNRINTFGTLHNCHYDEQWHGPGAWRTEGFEWTYEYRLRPGGILVAPRVLAEIER